MKLYTMRTLSMLAICLSTGLLLAGKKHDENKEHDSRKKIEVTTTKDSGHGSLRCAIEKANRLNIPEGVHIVFDLEKSDCGYNKKTETWVITPKTELPEITAPNVWVDFFSQKCSKPNTNSFCRPSNAILKIELDGSKATAAQANAKTTSAAIFPVAGLRFGARSFGSRVTALNAYHFSIGVHAFAPNVTIDGSVLSTDPTNNVSKPNIVADAVFEPSATNGLVGGISRAARTSFAARGIDLFDQPADVNNAAIATSFGSLTGRSSGLVARQLTININRAGTSQINPFALRGVVIDDATDDSDASDVAPVSSFFFNKIASAGHTLAEIKINNHRLVTGTDFSLGTTLNRSDAIKPLSFNGVLDASDAAAAFIPGDGIAIDSRLSRINTPIANLSGGVISGLNRGIVVGANSITRPVMNTTFTNLQIGTVAPNNFGVQSAAQGRHLLQDSAIFGNRIHGASYVDRFDNQPVSVKAKSNAALIGAISLLRNRFERQGDTAVFVTTSIPATSNGNTITNQPTGVAIGRAATYASLPTDLVTANHRFNYTFGSVA